MLIASATRLTAFARGRGEEKCAEPSHPALDAIMAKQLCRGSPILLQQNRTRAGRSLRPAETCSAASTHLQCGFKQHIHHRLDREGDESDADDHGEHHRKLCGREESANRQLSNKRELHTQMLSILEAGVCF